MIDVIPSDSEPSEAEISALARLLLSLPDPPSAAVRREDRQDAAPPNKKRLDPGEGSSR